MVEIGGLRDEHEVKILICYVLSNIETPLSFTEMTEVLQRDGLCNYFMFADALADLTERGQVLVEGEGEQATYTVTKMGRALAEQLKKTLPFTIREKSVKAAVKLLARKKRQAENKCEIQKSEAGYTVKLTVLDREDELLSVSVLVADQMQAEVVKKQFYTDPFTMYKGMLGLLTGDAAAVYETMMTRPDDMVQEQD